jgi:energy-coupling factor transport system permease protein
VSARTFHTRAWLVWLASAATVILAQRNPVATLSALGGLLIVATAFAPRAPEGRSAAFFLKLGILFLVLRVVLFGLTGHTGPTTLVTLPTLNLPGWIGGFALGGRVTAEVLAQAAAEGLRIAAFLVCFGVFLSVVEISSVIRLLPRFLFEAGLVVGIAITFVPVLLRSAAQVRDAQRLRGHRFRGARALRPLVLPVLANGMERSLTLAESMETRGYGRVRAGAQRAEAHARTVVLAGLLLLAAGGGLVLFGRLVGAAPALVGAALTGAGLRALSLAVPRTRYRPGRSGAGDVALVAATVSVAVVAIVARGSADWTAYPAVRAPALDLRLVALGLGLAAPVVLARLRNARIRRAARRAPVAKELVHA